MTLEVFKELATEVTGIPEELLADSKTANATLKQAKRFLKFKESHTENTRPRDEQILLDAFDGLTGWERKSPEMQKLEEMESIARTIDLGDETDATREFARKIFAR